MRNKMKLKPRERFQYFDKFYRRGETFCFEPNSFQWLHSPHQLEANAEMISKVEIIELEEETQWEYCKKSLESSSVPCGWCCEIRRRLSCGVRPECALRRALDDGSVSCYEWFWLQRIGSFCGQGLGWPVRSFPFQSLPESRSGSKCDRESPKMRVWLMIYFRNDLDRSESG